MAISPLALSAYKNALSQTGTIDSRVSRSLAKPASSSEGFGRMLTDSLKQVNDMQNSRAEMIDSFATGQTQNVHGGIARRRGCGRGRPRRTG